MVVRYSKIIAGAALVIGLCLPQPWAHAQDAPQQDLSDPLDPFDLSSFLNITTDEEADKGKTADKLLTEGYLLLHDNRLLDARTKFLRALKADPKNYKAHFMLSGYYMVHVGHFRLALKYIKRAQELFADQYGPPPYDDPEVKREHGNLLYYLSQIRLNLDNYQGSLDVLDQYKGYGYYDEWYPGTRSWVLMKLGQIDEAINVARLGVLAGAEKGRTLNMLGILLSMKGDRQEALEIFREAIKFEFSLGEEGQPATPLNNSGEVYKEMFADDKAESAWLKATSLPDGCEHVLPSLNLSILYFDQINSAGAKKAMDSFEGCIAQYPLRNGEEHRALVALARGRVALLTGKAEKAAQLFDDALNGIQWFGKIGTSQEDLQAAATLSLAQALDRVNNQLSLKQTSSWGEWAENLRARAVNRMRATWLERRARQILTEKLLDFEDIYVRNTDSMLEYPTLGEMASALPTVLLQRRLGVEKKTDNRVGAAPYYDAYLGENLIAHGDSKTGRELLMRAFSKSREHLDALLKVHVLAQLARGDDAHSKDYRDRVLTLFALSAPSVRNYGLRLPVNTEKGSTGLAELLSDGPFMPDNTVTLPYTLSYKQSGGEHILYLNSTNPRVTANREVRGPDFASTLNKLSNQVFEVELG